ncbi:hypothetical protein tb265_24200 [Gemmatimonadetes bacterium T265]|nr:hypothetical protein tb265_24200 [Gemmatimonadetes bacterium T265]
MAVGAAIALAAGRARAQSPKPSGDGKGKDPDVPAAYRPPPGMCRVWLAKVPPGQQPAPTDCASAVRNRPSNGRVLFGDDYVGKKPANTSHAGPNLLTNVADSAANAWRVTPALNVVSAEIPVAAAATTRATERTPTSAGRVAQDEYEAGYAAGYRDAMNGHRPRFRGADRADPGTGTTGYAVPGSSGYGQSNGGAVVVVPPGQDPRYFNNGRYPPPGRANGICLDRDGDGWCDDPRFGAPVCRDLDGDGRCDDYPGLAASPYPSSLPEMRAGVEVQQGRGSALALRWLGTSEVVARLVDPKRTGTPYRVLWFDANTNALLQSWTDLDGDGIADRVEIFRNGRRVKLLGR